MIANERRLVRGEFAGFKLDLIQALNSHKGLLKSDLSVATALIKHLGIESLQAYPSQETLSEITGMSVRNVIKCLERLRDGGWISWERGNMHKPNIYEFNEQKAAQEISRMKEEDAERTRRSRERKRMRPHVNSSSGREQAATCTPVHVSTCTPVQPNTFMEIGSTADDAAQEDAA